MLITFLKTKSYFDNFGFIIHPISLLDFSSFHKQSNYCNTLTEVIYAINFYYKIIDY